MASSNFVCAIILSFFLCRFSRGIFHTQEFANQTANRRIEPDSFTLQADSQSNITLNQLSSSLNSIKNDHFYTSLGKSNFSTLNQETIINMVQRRLDSIHGGKKRAKCDLKPNQIANITRIYESLRSRHYYGTDQEESPRVKIPHMQNPKCPETLFDIPPINERNVLGLCPWRVYELDLGYLCFPRYLPDVKCVCEACPSKPSSRCTEDIHVQYFLEWNGCQEGFAVFTMQNITTGTSCFCIHAGLQGLIPDINSEKVEGG